MMMNRVSVNMLLFPALVGTLLLTPGGDANGDAGMQAERLVGMVESDFGENDVRLGACILVGRRDSTLFAVISDHVVYKGKGEIGNPRIEVRLQQCTHDIMVAELTPHRDSQFDLAVLKLPDTCRDGSRIIAPTMALGRLDAVDPEAPVYTIGQSTDRSWQRSINPHRIMMIEWLELKVEPGPSVRPGHSGGALFDGDWRLIGMVRGGQSDPHVPDKDPFVAVRIDAVMSRLDYWGVPVNLWKGSDKCEMAIEVLTGQGGTVDVHQGARLLQEAADEGDPRAQMWIAIAKNHGLYTFKLDVSSANETAGKVVVAVRNLAAGGDPHAQYLLARAYAEGLGIERDPEKSEALLDASCDDGFLLSCYLDAANRITADPSPEKMVTAIADLEQLCDSQVMDACAHLGWIYQSGRGVVKNRDRAGELYENACQAGHPGACWRLGNDYYKTRLHAAQLFEKSCLGGERRGCRYLGRCYEDGEGVGRDYAAADRLFLKACDRGDWWSCWRRGHLIEQGRIDGTDEEYLLMLRLGCTGSVAEACRDLGKTSFDRAKEANDVAGMKEAFALFDQGCDLDDYEACRIALYLLEKDDRELAPPREPGAYAARACELLPIVSTNRIDNPHAEKAKACLAGATWLIDKGRDHGRAVKLLKRGCENRVAEACLRAAQAILNGSDDKTDAKDLLERGCNLGNVEACRSSANLLARKKDRSSPYDRDKMLEKACELRDNPSCKPLIEVFFDKSYLGHCSCGVVQAARNFCLQDGEQRSCTVVGYCNSIDAYLCPQERSNRQAGLPYLERGCDGGDWPGCYFLGRALARLAGERLRSEKEYYQRAFIAFSKGCDLGSLASCVERGYYLQIGQGTAKNPGEAALAYEGPCRHGIARACNNLGVLYEHGSGVAENLEKAAQLYRLGCKGGIAGSCQQLVVVCSKLPATGPCELPLPQ